MLYYALLIFLTSRVYLIYAIIRNGKYNTATAPSYEISILPNLWVTIPIIALVVAILSANLLLLTYIHVFTAILWTGTTFLWLSMLGFSNVVY